MKLTTIWLIVLAIVGGFASATKGEYYTSSDHMVILVHMSEDITSQLAFVVKRDEPKNKNLLK